MFMSEMEKLSKNDLSKVKKNESDEDNDKKILGRLELLLLVEGQKVNKLVLGKCTLS